MLDTREVEVLGADPGSPHLVRVNLIQGSAGAYLALGLPAIGLFRGWTGQLTGEWGDIYPDDPFAPHEGVGYREVFVTRFVPVHTTDPKPIQAITDAEGNLLIDDPRVSDKPLKITPDGKVLAWLGADTYQATNVTAKEVAAAIISVESAEKINAQNAATIQPVVLEAKETGNPASLESSAASPLAKIGITAALFYLFR